MKYLVIFLPIFIFSCKAKVTEHFSYPNRNEIIEIVETIITEDSLPISKKNFPADTILDENNKMVYRPIRFYLASDLRKFIIDQPDTAKFSPPHFGGIDIRRLLRLKINKKPVFNSNDSTFFLFQIDSAKTIDLNNELSSKYYTTTSEKERAKHNKIGNTYYDISVPIFSKDLKRAYVEINNNSNSGGYVILEKINGKWIIIDRQITWMV